MKATVLRKPASSDTASVLSPDPLAQERRAFQRQRRQLLRRYAGEYVALQAGRVVGHDRDDEALAARMFAQVGDAPFLIVRVEETASVSEIPSPELGR